MQKSTASKPKNATINDVAQHAGVSYQTVSRVINDHPSVAPETRERIEAAIRSLDYHPSTTARNLAAKHSPTIGVVSYGITHYGPAQMLASLELAARARGYTMSDISLSELTLEQISDAIQTLRRQRVDGIIMFTPLLEAGSKQIEALCADIPLVLTDAEPKAGRYVTSVDQFTGSRLAAQHLVELGHRKIALINGPRQWYAALLRHQGWQSVLHQAKLQAVADVESDWTAAGGYRVTRGLLESKLAFTGLLVGNDQMALGALRALHQHGLSLPRDVSVVGFDDIPEAAYLEPPLTTIRQDFSVLAQQGLDQLVSRIENPNSKAQVTVLMPTLVVRDSTAPPRSESR